MDVCVGYMGWTDESDLTSRHPFKSTHAMRCFSTGTARQVRTTLAARTGDMQVCVSDRVSVCVYACQWPSFMRLIMCVCVCVCALGLATMCKMVFLVRCLRPTRCRRPWRPLASVHPVGTHARTSIQIRSPPNQSFTPVCSEQLLTV